MSPVIMTCARVVLFAAAFGWARPAHASPAEIDARQTVVIANANVPESIELARYYMTARNIPSNHLCLVDLPGSETVSRRLYDTRLRSPLQSFLRDQGLIEQVKRDADETDPNENEWRTTKTYVRYLVSMYGMPLRVAGTRPYLLDKLNRLTGDPGGRDSAAVDSELACLLWQTYEIKRFQTNPLYNDIKWNGYDGNPFPVLIAARLDGPSPDHVKRMIDDAVAVERTGLSGRAYIDLRSIRDPGYILGDYWLGESAERLIRMGFDIGVDTNAGVFPENRPMDDAAVYLGWYTEHVEGPFLRESFRFLPGAIAYHLHSSSARTLRSTTEYWAGPLINAGAAAVMGCVDEPLLTLTPDLQIFTDRLCAGFSFGESAYYAQRGLSWQVTVVGDPLYRPFAARDEKPTFEADAAADDPSDWTHVLFMSRLASQQRLNQALQFGREALAIRESVIIREKLADLYTKNNLFAEAVASYEKAIAGTSDDEKAAWIAFKLRNVWLAQGKAEEAERVRASFAERWPGSPFLSYLDEFEP